MPTAAQPHLWHKADLEGKNQFSVWGDSLYPLGDALYVVTHRAISVIFKNDPFYPVVKTTDQVKPLTAGWSVFYDGALCRLAKNSSIQAPLPLRFKDIKTWKNSILGRTDTRWIWQPGSPFELSADSIRLFSQLLVLFQPSGLVMIDSTLTPRFYPIRGENKRFSPTFSYVLTDSVWQPLAAERPAFAHKSNAVWWNDTSLADTTGRGIFLQTIHQARTKIGDSLRVLNPNFLAIRSKNKWTIRTAWGKTVRIADRFTTRLINDTLLAVRSKKSHITIGLSGNKTTLNPSITEVKQLSEGLILAKDDLRFGFVDLHGYIRIACRYDSLLPFVQGLAGARIHNRWGLLNRDEKIMVQPHFQQIKMPRNGLYAVEHDGKWGLLKTNGEVALSSQFDAIEPAAYSGWILTKGNWKGWANDQGQMMIQPKYFSTIELPFGMIQLERNHLKGLAAQSGTPVLPIAHNAIYINPDMKEVIYR